MPKRELTVVVESATDIIDPSLEGRGSSYCTLQHGSQVFSTAVVEGGSSSPIFNAKFVFEIDESVSDLSISVYSRNISGDDQLIGSATLDFRLVFFHGDIVPLTAFPLQVSSEKSRGFINISLTLEPVVEYAVPHLPKARRARASRRFVPGSPRALDEDFRSFVERLIPRISGHTSPEPKPGNAHLDGPGQAEDLWKTYIQCGEFEEFCDAHGIHGEDKLDMGRGRLTAALFPATFCRHLAAVMLASEASGAQDFPQYFKDALDLVLEDLPYAKNNLQNGGFQFFDEAWHGDPVNVDVIFHLGGLISICQQFLPESEYQIEYCIVQHDLTGVYLCRPVERFAFDVDPVMEKATGVLGLEATCDDIHVENVRDDGSYYSGTLEDFSYEFVPNENGELDDQCATRLFGNLRGAEFLAGREKGLKCSPLLAIALAIATDRKKLVLEWNMTHGHMEIGYSRLTRYVNAKWQILYMDNINQLGFAVEWGMEQAFRASSSSLAQAETSRSPVSHREENNSYELQALASVFHSGVMQKRTVGGSLTFPGGVGFGGSVEQFGSKGKELAKAAYLRIMERLRRSSGRFVETKNLDAEHVYVKENLLQGRLSELPNNYLIVGDNVDHGYVSIYWADDEHNKYTWITDIVLPDGKGSLFKGGLLKGLRMEVERNGSKFVTLDASKPASDLISRFKRHKKLDIVDNNMTPVPQGSQSNDEWVHLIGHQEKFSGNKYLWEATHMRAIVSSRTSFSSGALLEMYVLQDKFGDIGYCARGKTEAPLVHHCANVMAWGQFSKAPASLVSGAGLIKWGGLFNENDLS